MIPRDKENRVKVITYMLAHCNTESDNLTEWEDEFIVSLSEQFNMKNDLSDRQCELLEKICDLLIEQ